MKTIQTTRVEASDNLRNKSVNPQDNAKITIEYGDIGLFCEIKNGFIIARVNQDFHEEIPIPLCSDLHVVLSQELNRPFTKMSLIIISQDNKVMAFKDDYDFWEEVAKVYPPTYRDPYFKYYSKIGNIDNLQRLVDFLVSHNKHKAITKQNLSQSNIINFH